MKAFYKINKGKRALILKSNALILNYLNLALNVKSNLFKIDLITFSTSAVSNVLVESSNVILNAKDFSSSLIPSPV